MKILKLITFYFLFIAFLSGCGMWSNFTTYFNRYYNAKKAFESAEEKIAEQKKPLFEYKEIKIPGSANKDLDAVIDKCSKILQFNNNSSYVSDALFMIGKAFYYQQNYSKASRKFLELAARNDEDFTIQDKLWIGKTEMKLRNFDSANEILDTVRVMATAEEENEIIVDALISQIQFLIYREKYDDAIDKIAALTEVAEDDALKAEITYELGNLYYKIDSLELAKNAFLEVEEYSPTFEIQFNSKLKFAEVSRKLGETEKALDLLDDLRYEDKFKKDRDRVEVEIGLMYMEQGKVEEAESMLMEVDSVYKSKPSVGIASYNLGLIQENYYKNLDSAGFYYQKVMRIQNVPLEIKNDARKKNRLLNQYTILRQQYEKQELQFLYATDSLKFLQDSVDYAYLQKQKRLQSQQGRGTAPVSSLNNNNRNSNNISGTEALQDSSSSLNEVSELEYSGNIVKYKPIKPVISPDSINSLRARSRYDLANLFLTEFEVADSAFLYYNSILTDFPESYMTAKTLFALGSYYLTVNDSAKADSLYQYVYDNYPQDEIAVAAAKKLGRATQSEDDIIEKSFEKAEAEYLNENYDVAIDSLFSIYKSYPKTDYAPKSLYTIGYLLQNKLNNIDSAVAVYDTLATKYKRSQYTLKISAPLSFFKKEKKRIQDSIKHKIISDSLAAAKALLADSTSITDSLGIRDSLSSTDSISTNDSTFIKTAADSSTVVDTSKEKIKKIEPKFSEPKEKKLKEPEIPNPETKEVKSTTSKTEIKKPGEPGKKSTNPEKNLPIIKKKKNATNLKDPNTEK